MEPAKKQVEVSPEDVRIFQEMMRGAFRGHPEEEEVCMYNDNHRIRLSKFAAHVENCREVFFEAKLEKNEPIFKVTCKYNHKHRVPPVELEFHEARCDDRHFVPGYMVYALGLKNIPKEVDKIKYREKLRHFITDPEEKSKYQDGFLVNQFFGGGLPPLLKPVDIEALPHLKRGEKMVSDEEVWGVLEDKKKTERKTSQPTPKKTNSNLPSPKLVVIDEEGTESNPDEDAGSSTTEDDEVEWGSATNEPSFAYMQRVYNPKRPVLGCPPGLNKQQQKNFAKWNKEWINRIMAETLLDVNYLEDPQPEVAGTSLRERFMPESSPQCAEFLVNMATPTCATAGGLLSLDKKAREALEERMKPKTEEPVNKDDMTLKEEAIISEEAQAGEAQQEEEVKTETPTEKAANPQMEEETEQQVQAGTDTPVVEAKEETENQTEEKVEDKPAKEEVQEQVCTNYVLADILRQFDPYKSKRSK